MSIYIDADEFYVSQVSRCRGEPIIGTCTSDNALLYDELQKMPTSDVVEVIRCKDCENCLSINNRYMCTKNAIYDNRNDEFYGLCAVKKEHFCSYGERFCIYGEREDEE